MDDHIKKIADKFAFDGELIDITPVSIGLINDSYILKQSMKITTLSAQGSSFLCIRYNRKKW